MPGGLVTAFSVVKVRPEAAMMGKDLARNLSSASVSLTTQLGNVNVSWRVEPDNLPPLPLPPSAQAPVSPCGVQPQFPIPGSGLCSGQQYINLSCAPGEVIGGVVYAKLGNPKGWLNGTFDKRDGGWFCYGPQPPPVGDCEKDISDQVLHRCQGANACTVPATIAAYGSDPCQGKHGVGPGYQVAVRVKCKPSSHVSPSDQATKAEQEQMDGYDQPAYQKKLSYYVDGLRQHLSKEESRSENVIHLEKLLLQMNVTVPPGSKGEVHVPAYYIPDQISITESGAPVWVHSAFVSGHKGVEGVISDDRFITFSTAAGTYSFAVYAVGIVGSA